MVALLLANNMPIGGDYNVPIWVGITVFVLVYSSQVAALSNIPTAVYGYAVMAGYSLLTGASATDLASATTANPLWAVAVSIVQFPATPRIDFLIHGCQYMSVQFCSLP